MSNANAMCDDCGLCCMHMATPLFCGDSDPEWRRLPEKLQQQIKRWIYSPRRMLADEQPCIWLDQITGKCRHYGLRPRVCREYEVGCDSCRKLRRSAELPVEGMPVVEEES